MNFWQFASEYPTTTVALACVLCCTLLALGSQVVDVVKAMSVRLAKMPAPGAIIPGPVSDPERPRNLALEFAIHAPSVPDWFRPVDPLPEAPSQDAAAHTREFLTDNYGKIPKEQWPKEVTDYLALKQSWDDAVAERTDAEVERLAEWPERYAAMLAARWEGKVKP